MTDQLTDPVGERFTIRFERFYPHPIARVWEALTRREHLAAWLWPDSDVEARSGICTGRTDDEALAGAMAEYQPLRAVEYAFEDGCRVRFELTAVPGGTRLVAVHSTPPGLADRGPTEQSGDGLYGGKGTPRHPFLGQPGAVGGGSPACERAQSDASAGIGRSDTYADGDGERQSRCPLDQRRVRRAARSGSARRLGGGPPPIRRFGLRVRADRLDRGDRARHVRHGRALVGVPVRRIEPPIADVAMQHRGGGRWW